MAGVFLRHIVNGLDQRYTTPYVETLEGDRSGLDSAWHRLLRIGGFAIVFLALLRIAVPGLRRGLEPARWRYPATPLLAAIPTIPSAVETRFLLPLFLLAAILIVSPAPWTPLGELVRQPTRLRPRRPTRRCGDGVCGLRLADRHRRDR